MTMGKYAGKGTELRGTAWQFPEVAAGRLLFMHFIRQLCCRNRQRGKALKIRRSIWQFLKEQE